MSSSICQTLSPIAALHLIRLPLELKAFHQWAADRGYGWTAVRGADGRTRNTTFDEGRALHHLLAETFGNGVMQPFRLFMSPGGAKGNIYAYSQTDKAGLVETARACSLPETQTICDCARLDAKVMPEVWREGRRLAFDVRVRPVRRLFKPCGGFPKGAEVDAFLVEALRRYPDGRPVEADNEVKREAVYVNWLKERFDAAARPDSVRLVRFARHRAARDRHASDGPDATLHGELVIRDPAPGTVKRDGFSSDPLTVRQRQQPVVLAEPQASVSGSRLRTNARETLLQSRLSTREDGGFDVSVVDGWAATYDSRTIIKIVRPSSLLWRRLEGQDHC